MSAFTVYLLACSLLICGANDWHWIDVYYIDAATKEEALVKAKAESVRGPHLRKLAGARVFALEVEANEDHRKVKDYTGRRHRNP